ncbi:Cytosol aminopeptidase, catalytic domain [Chamberlinius hualienensis]
MPVLDIVCPLVAVTDINDGNYDAVLVVTDTLTKLTGPLDPLKSAIEDLIKIDKNAENTISVIRIDSLPSKRCIFSPTGPLSRDYDDVRRFADAVDKGIKRCLQAGSKSPLLVRAPDDSFEKADLVSILSALHAVYVPIETRERTNTCKSKMDKIGVWGPNVEKVNQLITVARAVESGRIVGKDIGGSDPERMAAPKVATYLETVFANSNVEVGVTSSQEFIEGEYPLLAAVNRCAKTVTRHQARVIALKYEGSGPIDTTLMLVGKGVTYDTGGADIKAGGIMAGMHRDKCGAAAIAGFFQVLNVLKPPGLKVIGSLAMVRNSVGSDCYVADELLVARSGVVVRVGNTDAEGRMAMVDLLCQMKEMAVSETNPHLMTIATLTGHACLACGDDYSAIIDNGPAKKSKFSHLIQETGDSLGDPFEVSTLRREDYDFINGKSEYEDVIQCNNQPSSRTPRGHQFPAAFLVRVSGLDKYGIDSDKPIKYSHIDIAGSSGPFPGVPTGSPIVALSGHFVLPRL